MVLTSQWPLQLQGCLGIIVFLLLAWSLSRNIRAINYRLLWVAMGFQLLVAAFVFQSDLGQKALLYVNDGVVALLQAAQAGPKFVFGSLADASVTNEVGIGFILLFQGLSTIIVLSALLAVLYYVGVMGRLLKLFAIVFSRSTRISGAEALAASANMFVGNESILAIKPCLPRLTRSEFCTLLATCMATISANVLGTYVSFLTDHFPSIGGHLISATVISVPAAVLLAKLAVPETETPETLGIDIDPHIEQEQSLLETILGGGETGFQLIVGIVTMLIAVVGLLAIVNMILGVIGRGVDPNGVLMNEWTIQGFLAYVFYPMSWLMGIPTADIPEVSRLLGIRIIATEIPAYIELASLIAEGKIEPRSAVIASYSLCGFTHIASMAIYVGGVAALVPQRRSDIASVAWQALFVATLACCMTGAIAGLFFQNDSLLGF